MISIPFLENLDADQIRQWVDSSFQGALADIQVLSLVDSTNTYLLARAKENSAIKGTMVFAEEQTKGRGRQGKVWFSPKGVNLYGSFLWQMAENSAALSGLSLAVAVIVMRAVQKVKVVFPLAVKWPNDVLVLGRKLAGILIERSGSFIVIGIGLNIHLPEGIYPQWIGLSEIAQQKISRNQIAGLLVNELIKGMMQFEKEGFAAFLSEFRVHDALFQKPIDIVTSQATLSGVMQGVNAEGELLLQDEKGILQRFCYGEVSVRYPLA